MKNVWGAAETRPEQNQGREGMRQVDGENARKCPT